MCGIAGFIACPGKSISMPLAESIGIMTGTLKHRGPDDSGVWADAVQGIALGHRRLSIVDLSVHGHQPMVSESGRYVISYNGEIYNFEELRARLDGSGCRNSWKGRSDTEVFLACVERWGIDGALRAIIGMFAFALLDRNEHTLYLARDRVGKKPLYYGWVNGHFVFGSELKALKAFPGFSPRIDRQALTAYLRYNYIPAPYSIYSDVFKLPPASLLALKLADIARKSLQISAYWSLKQEIIKKGTCDFTESEAEIEFERLLRDAVRKRMVSDVPLGAFLSGGIDSSLVVALMQQESSRPVKTFSIGMHEQGYNEAEHAKEVARHLGTDHTEFYITPEEACRVIPKLAAIFDEPFADSSQVPTYLVSELTQKHVTVCLSGDGGDELFCGYNRYFLSRNIWKKVRSIPYPLRKVLAGLLKIPTPAQWDNISGIFGHMLKDVGAQGTFGDKFGKIASVLSMRSPDELYLRLVTHWDDPACIVIGASEPKTMPLDPESGAFIGDFTRRMMFLDFMTCLPDDIMTKIDRSTMAVGLESRAPFLDHRLVEFSWKLPLSMLYREKKGKHIVGRVLYKYVPENLVDRPKWGFGIPVGRWLRGGLRDWAETLLDKSRLDSDGFFKSAIIRQKWDEHVKGARNWQFLLWDILMFQTWKESVLKNESVSEQIS